MTNNPRGSLQRMGLFAAMNEFQIEVPVQKHIPNPNDSGYASYQ